MRIHAIQTGVGILKESFVVGSVAAGGLLPFFIGLRRPQPTMTVPILAWVIDHPEGIFIIDCGDSSETGTNPFTRVILKISTEEDFGPSLDRLDLDPGKPRKLLLTHLHGDHVNGLNSIHAAETLVGEREYAYYRSWGGRLLTRTSCRVPKTVKIKPLTFTQIERSGFTQWAPLTRSKDIFAFPTPGHTIGHISVVAVIDGIHCFLAGDLSYDDKALLSGTVQGPSMAPELHRQSLRNALEYVNDNPTVYLPSHDPNSRSRLQAMEVTR